MSCGGSLCVKPELPAEDALCEARMDLDGLVDGLRYLANNAMASDSLICGPLLGLLAMAERASMLAEHAQHGLDAIVRPVHAAGTQSATSIEGDGSARSPS